MIKRYHSNRRQDTSKQYKVNERIFAATVRVLDAENKQIGVMPKAEALARARALGIDLVEIAPNANPPVAKLVDYRKFLYALEKKKQEEKKKTKLTETKEVRLGPFMGENDLDVMARRARGFLEGGNKVKFVVKFSGRQITHPEFGYKILQKVFTKIEDLAKIERDAKLEGKQLSLIVAVERKIKNAKEENTPISQ